MDKASIQVARNRGMAGRDGSLDTSRVTNTPTTPLIQNPEQGYNNITTIVPPSRQVLNPSNTVPAASLVERPKYMY